MDLSWQSLSELTERHGDSFYLLDMQAFESNYRDLLGSFQRLYPNTNIGYSYKTNYIPKLCSRVNALGGYAEVVSGMEYELALRVGVAPQRIIFNGPYKTEHDLSRALLGGSIVNLDSSYELDLVEKIARAAPETEFTVGLRCNFDVGSGQVSRFGFDIGSDEFAEAVERLRSIPNCGLAGLHCHYSTGAKSLESYTLRTREMLALTTRWFPDAAPRYLDIGGGFFSRMSAELRKQFDFPVPDFADYGAAVASLVAEAFPGDTGPELIIEPGSAVTADIMRFAARIVDVKTVRSRTVVLAAGSVHNVKPTLHAKNLPMRVLRAPGATTDRGGGPLDIVGYTCMEHDVLYHDYDGAVTVGDYVLIENIGAYTIVMKPPFISPSPPILAHNGAPGEFEIARHREQTSDVFATYVFDGPGSAR